MDCLVAGLKSQLVDCLVLDCLEKLSFCFHPKSSNAVAEIEVSAENPKVFYF